MTSAAEDRLYVNDERTVLVRIWAVGFYWRIRRSMVELLGWRGYLKAIWDTEREASRV